METKRKIVRARQRAWEDMPDRVKCCAQKASLAKPGVIVEVYPDTALLSYGRCSCCGATQEAITMLVVGSDGARCIAVEMYDLDEGA